tara:strand:- start:2063 stop:2626 length:564 start_codon:yes stop_codon:yes gene_type:complete
MSWTEEEINYKTKIPNFLLLEKAKYINKRIQREIISIQKCIDNDIKQEKGVKFNNIEPSFIDFEIKSDNIIIFNILFKYKYTLSFKLTFKSEYPFKPPECTIIGNKENDYKILLARISEHYYKNKETKQKTKRCLCCDTIVCRNNWNPRVGISTLIEEINTNTTYMYDIVYKMLENKIYEKHLGYKL